MTLFFFVNSYCNCLLILFTLCITHHSHDSLSCGPTVPFLISPFVMLYHYVVYAYDSSYCSGLNKLQITSFFFTFDHTHPYSTHPSSLSPIIIKIGGPVLEIQP